MNPARVVLLGVSVASFLLLGTGCSSFRRDAKAAKASAPKAGSVEGLWEGRWSSAEDPEHGGSMQMVLTRTGETLYHASSRSHWWRIFRSAYDTQVVVTPVRPGEFMLTGGRSLWGFGEYSITGRVDSVRLDADFWVGKDRGRIELQRPMATAAP